MRAVVAAVCGALLLTACGQHSRSGEFAGLTRAKATALSVRVARTMQQPIDVLERGARRPSTVVGTFRGTNSGGDHAWLTIFRYREANDPDQACVWAWRAHGGPWPYGYEDVASVAYGQSPDAVHDRCAREVFRRGIAKHDQDAGSEAAPPDVASPQPMTPFGPLAAGTFPVDLVEGTAISLTGTDIFLPAGGIGGTCGFGGFVIDEGTERVIPGAQVAVVASKPWSGISDGSPWGWPDRAVTAVADRDGAFAFDGLPGSSQGYDVSIRASGYGPARIVHETCDDGNFGIGDWQLARTVRFEDGTPHPVGR